MPPPAPSPPLPCLLLALRRGTNDPQTFYSLGLHIPSILEPPPSPDSESDNIFSLPHILSSVSLAITNRASGAQSLFFAGESNTLSSTSMLEIVSSGARAAWIHLASATCFNLVCQTWACFHSWCTAGSLLRNRPPALSPLWHAHPQSPQNIRLNSRILGVSSRHHV
jgi:hypothetical protein